MPSRHISIVSLVTLLFCACASHQAQLAVFSQAADSGEPAPVTESVPGSPKPPAPTQLAAAQAVQGILVSGLIDPRPVDFWQQLRMHFALPEQDNKRIRTHRNWYIRHPEYLRRVAQRAQPYAWYIHEEIRRRGMPAEIVLLPIVESAYDPFAYSHGRAAGLWQFIPATGKRFGLQQNWWYDGRRDVIDSTTAALDYLDHLQQRFKGDWLLALAAYNSGEGTVMKAQRRNRRKGRPAGFWDLDLPRETREYVPKLIALKQLVDTPAKYNVELGPIAARPRFEIIATEAQIDLAIAADLADMPLELLYRFNPGFNQWATAPEGPHRLVIPSEHAATFRQAIADLPPEARVRWIRHKIGAGETLTHIAKRYQTTVAALKQSNNLHNSSIRAGRHLLVPVASKGKESYTLSAQQRLARKKNLDRGGQRTEHVVGNGDTLWELSKSYRVSFRRLASWNGMAPGDTLRVGQKLVVWTDAATSPAAHPGTQVRPVHYTVRRGDSLSRIANRFRVTVGQLRKWNGLSTGRYLQPGQRLKLYVDVTKQAGV
jgi:membrane-bound lytic murein transglycosylase D